MLSKPIIRLSLYFIKNVPVKCGSFTPVCSTSVRHCHVEGSVSFKKENSLQDSSTELTGQIPDPPALLDETQYELHGKIARDSLAYYGLDTWYPCGFLRSAMQYLHVTTGIPWWEVILIGVVVGRLAIFPFTLRNMRQMGGMKKFQPQITKITEKMNDARKAGDYVEMQLAQYELMKVQKLGGIDVTSTFKNMIPQVVYFASYFIAIKRMASAPLESMKEGGLFWFTDLTAVDPTWILSIVCASTLAITLRTGVDIPTEGMAGTTKKIMQLGFPIFVLFSTHYFPSAVLIYWTTSNAVSLSIALLLRSNRVRSVLKLQPLPAKVEGRTKQKFNVDGVPVEKLSFFQRFKRKYRHYTTEKWQKKAPFEADLRNADHVAFRKAGQGPIVPTFPYNPHEKYADIFQKPKDNFLQRLFKRFVKPVSKT